MSHSRAVIGGVPIDAVTHDEALTAIDALITRGAGGYVVTPNVDHIVLANGDERMRSAQAGASLALPDGQPVVWMARLLGHAVPARVSGSDLIWPLLARAAARGWKVFCFGASEAVSREAQRRMLARHPDLRLVGFDCGYWSADDDRAPDESSVVRAVRQSGADLVIVALSAPRQEYWLARHAHALAPAVALGLGASLDFVAGAVDRAPAWVSQAGCEWLYRLVQEPRRLTYRYLVRDARILPIFVRDVARRLGRRLPAPAAPIDDAAAAAGRPS